MLVTKNVPSQQKPYVELDKFEMNCINYLGKNDGIGLWAEYPSKTKNSATYTSIS